MAQQPAPAAAFRCSHCQTSNPVGRKFCANCGQPLWEHCIECGAVASAGERFCGACGVDLAQAVHERVRRCQTILQETAQLDASGLYDEALAMLGVVARETHGHLRGYAQQAEKMIANLAQHREARRAEAEAANAKASQYVEAGQYERALTVLTAVPEKLRNEAMQEFVDDLRGRLDGIARLEREIHELLAAKDTLGLLEKVGELLTLKPRHPGARQLSSRLLNQVHQAARKKLQECQYGDAARLLAHVPPNLHTADTRQLTAEATELAWLAWDLRSAPAVDETLLAVGQRLCRLAPADQRAARLVTELQRRAKKAGEPPGRTVTWAARPEPTVTGCPIEQLTAFERVTFADGLDRSFVDRHVGRFFSAYGLALQGVEQATFQTNLATNEGIGLVERMSRLVRSSSTRAAWGIDLGRSALKAIKLAVDPQSGATMVADHHFQEHRKPLGEAINKAEEHAILDQALAEFVQQNDIKGARICVGVPRLLVFARQFHLPPMPEDKLDSALEFEIRHQGLGRPDELVWDYQVLNPSEDGPPSEGFDVLVVACRQVLLDSYLERFTQARLRPDIAQSDCLAAYNAIHYETANNNHAAHNEPHPASDTIALLDVGSDSSSIIVGSNRQVSFREIGFGSQSLTRALAREYQLTFAQAEQLKLHPESAEQLSRLYQAVTPVLAGIAEESQRFLEARASLDRPQRVNRMLGVGGGFQFHGLWTYLLTGNASPRELHSSSIGN